MNEDNPIATVLKCIAIFLLLYFILLVFNSCNSLKKTQRYLFEHPEFASGYCAEQYPVKDSIVVRDSVSYDTTYFDRGETSITSQPFSIDSSESVTYGTGMFRSIKPDTVRTIKMITKTIRKDSVIWKDNPAKEKRLQLALEYCQGNNNDLLKQYNDQQKVLALWKGKAKTRFWWILLLIGAVTGYGFFKLKSNFSLKKFIT